MFFYEADFLKNFKKTKEFKDKNLRQNIWWRTVAGWKSTASFKSVKRVSLVFLGAFLNSYVSRYISMTAYEKKYYVLQSAFISILRHN